MKKLFVLLILFLIISCNNSRDEPSDATNIDNGIALIIKNKDGQDLLSTTTVNSLNTDKIKLFYVVNGQPQEVFFPNLDYPRMFHIINYVDSKAIAISLNNQSTDEFPLAYIKWNESDTDTIKAHFNRGIGNDGSFVICDKVWYNDQLVYPIAENQNLGRIINLVK